MHINVCMHKVDIDVTVAAKTLRVSIQNLA